VRFVFKVGASRTAARYLTIVGDSDSPAMDPMEGLRRSRRIQANRWFLRCFEAM
jgi:hypothetical protein